MSVRQIYETAFDSAVTPAQDADYLDELAQSPLLCGSTPHFPQDVTPQSSGRSTSTKPMLIQNFDRHRPWTIGPKHHGKPLFCHRFPKTQVGAGGGGISDRVNYPVPCRPHSDPLDRRKADSAFRSIAENNSKSNPVFHLPLEQSSTSDSASKTFSPSTEFKKLEVGGESAKPSHANANSLLECLADPNQLAIKPNPDGKVPFKARPLALLDTPKLRGDDNFTVPKCLRDDIKRNHEDTNTSDRFKLNLDFNQPPKRRRRHILEFWTPGHNTCQEVVDPSLELEKQGWYHGSINHKDAEKALRLLKKGSFLVRCCKTPQHNYSLSIKSTSGVMHMKISQSSSGRFVLKHQSQSFDSIPEMVYHFSVNPLPVYGLEQVVLKSPVINQLL